MRATWLARRQACARWYATISTRSSPAGSAAVQSANRLCSVIRRCTPLARIEQEAERPPGGDDLLVLARQCSCGGFVEAAHAVRDLAFMHQREPSTESANISRETTPSRWPNSRARSA